MRVVRYLLLLLGAIATVADVRGLSPALAAGPADGLNVNVVNAPTVLSADNPALQPVSVQYLVHLPAGSLNNTSAGPFYTVPAGKRLVIEFVNAEFHFEDVSNTGRVFFQIQVDAPDFTHKTHAIGTSSDTAPCDGSAACLVVAKPVRIYANPGDQISVYGSFALAQSSPASLFKGTINGHLVNLP